MRLSPCKVGTKGAAAVAGKHKKLGIREATIAPDSPVLTKVRDRGQRWLAQPAFEPFGNLGPTQFSHRFALDLTHPFPRQVK